MSKKKRNKKKKYTPTISFDPIRINQAIMPLIEMIDKKMDMLNQINPITDRYEFKELTESEITDTTPLPPFN